jgi:hypothetical protein
VLFSFLLAPKKKQKKAARKETAPSLHRISIKLLYYCGEDLWSVDALTSYECVCFLLEACGLQLVASSNEVLMMNDGSHRLKALNQNNKCSIRQQFIKLLYLNLNATNETSQTAAFNAGNSIDNSNFLPERISC